MKSQLHILYRVGVLAFCQCLDGMRTRTSTTADNVSTAGGLRPSGTGRVSTYIVVKPSSHWAVCVERRGVDLCQIDQCRQSAEFDLLSNATSVS